MFLSLTWARRASALLLGAALSVAPGLASAGNGKGILAPAGNQIDVNEALGAPLDSGLRFTDQDGKSVTLGDYFDGKRPVLLTMNYFRCPVLCNVQLNGLTDTLRELDWVPGENFRIVTVSIDPREDSELARAKRQKHLESLGKGDAVEWDFLTGDAANIRLLAAQLGISYDYDSEQDQYAHPAVITFASPEGKISRYLYGLTYAPKDLKFAAIESAEGRVGSTIDRLILSCFHYDPEAGSYSVFAMGTMRLGGVAMILILGIPLAYTWRRERRRSVSTLEARA